MGNKLCVKAKKKKGYTSDATTNQPSTSDVTDTGDGRQSVINSFPAHLWYRHSGQDDVSFNNINETEYKRFASMDEILKDVGQHFITHLSAGVSLIPVLSTIAPRLTHLRLQGVIDDTALQALTELKDLQALNLKANNFTRGLPSVIGELYSLVELNLSDCSLTDLPQSLKDLIQLQKLDLDDNEFEDGLPSVVGELTSLNSLDVASCSLRDLPQSLTNLTHLQRLDLSGNDFDHGLPSVVGVLTSLNSLDVGDCSLKDLPQSLKCLKQLQRLDLSFNKFDHGLPSVVGELTSLNSLDVSNCSLKDLPQSLKDLKQLQRLDLSGNEFDHGLPSVVGELISLNRLDVSRCSLRDLPESLRDLIQLQRLDLSGNKFDHGLPSVVGDLTSLNSLDVGGCYLKNLPKSLRYLKQLQRLDLGGNIFNRGLPSVVGELTSLNSLDVKGSYLKDLPKNLKDLKQLQRLDLTGSRFNQGLPSVVGELTSLNSLDVSMCSLKDLPQSLKDLKQLQMLDLYDNEFGNGLPSVVGELTSLNSLDVTRCSLKDLPQSLKNLKQLQRLDLTGSNFDHGLPSVVGELTSLNSLGVAKCSLKDLPQSLKDLKQLQRLDLRESKFDHGLPSVVGELMSLNRLDVARCSLEDLPKSLSNLQLQELILDENIFKELPAVVYELKYLRRLEVNRTYSLDTIEDKILQLVELQRLGLEDCDSLQSPEYAICQLGLPAIRSYFKDIAGGVAEVATIPVAIIGEKLSGKTSLVKSLKLGKRDLTYRDVSSPLDETTRVFNFEEIKLGKSTIRLIDHGGHEVYHIAYQLALRNECVPLIVVDIKSFATKASEVGYEKATRLVCFDWLSHLYLASPGLGRPILALTHTDKLSTEDLEECRDKLLDTAEVIRTKWLKKERRCKVERSHHLTGFTHLSNITQTVFSLEDVFEFSDGKKKDETTNIHNLKENIQRRCQDLEREIPQSWDVVAQFVEKQSEKPYIRVKKIGEAFPDADLDTILRYLHNKGTIMWFEQKVKTDRGKLADGDNLAEFVFHKIPAITDMIALLFHHSSEKHQNAVMEKFAEFEYEDWYVGPEEYKKLLIDFNEDGVLARELLQVLVSAGSNFEFIIAEKLLQAFNIIHGPFELKDTHPPRKVYTIPFFVKKSMDSAWKHAGRLQLRLDIVFNGLPLPEYVYQLMTVEVLNTVEEFDTVEAMCDGVIVEHEDSTTYLVHDYSAHKVILQVSTCVKELPMSWIRLKSTAECIVHLVSNQWKACRIELKNYCAHCLFLRDVDPGYKIVKRDWLQPYQAAGIEPVACLKAKIRDVPKPIVFPCCRFYEVSELDAHLTKLELQRIPTPAGTGEKSE